MSYVYNYTTVLDRIAKALERIATAMEADKKPPMPGDEVYRPRW